MTLHVNVTASITAASATTGIPVDGRQYADLVVLLNEFREQCAAILATEMDPPAFIINDIDTGYRGTLTIEVRRNRDEDEPF